MKIRIWFRDIKIGIKNLIRWFPIIWNDRNWDYCFIFIMLKKKLELMEHGIRNGINMYADDVADNIKLCNSLLNRIIEDNYHEIAFKDVDKRWGELKLKWEDVDTDYSKLLIEREKAITEEEKKIATGQSLAAGEHAEYLYDQDVEYLFKLMNKYIRHWWD